MNVFATLKTVFFGSKFLSSPVPIDGTPRRDLVSALNGLMPLCRTIPGVRLALDIREGQVVLALNWTPRTDGNAPTGSYHYIVSDEDGVKEMADSQVLLTENGKDNLPGSMDDSRTHPTVSTEKTEKDSAHLKKDVQKKAEPISSEDTGKKAKSHTLMQEVTAFLTSRYRFRFNVLTEETEVASVENNIPDTHLRYAKVDERWMNSLSLEAIETGIDCWDRDIQRFVRSRRISEYHPFTAYFEQLPEWDGTDRVSALARRVSDDPVWVNGFHRWMLGLSAQWMQLNPDNNRANSVAPLLVSSRQGLGKSTFCRLLMPDRLKSYYTESYDLSSPASAEAKLAAYGLINLDEFDKLGASKMPLLKNLMQASALNIRKAYKHSASSTGCFRSQRTGHRTFHITRGTGTGSYIDRLHTFCLYIPTTTGSVRSVLTTTCQQHISGRAGISRYISSVQILDRYITRATGISREIRTRYLFQNHITRTISGSRKIITRNSASCYITATASLNSNFPTRFQSILYNNITGTGSFQAVHSRSRNSYFLFMFSVY